MRARACVFSRLCVCAASQSAGQASRSNRIALPVVPWFCSALFCSVSMVWVWVWCYMFWHRRLLRALLIGTNLRGILPFVVLLRSATPTQYSWCLVGRPVRGGIHHTYSFATPRHQCSLHSLCSVLFVHRSQCSVASSGAFTSAAVGLQASWCARVCVLLHSLRCVCFGSALLHSAWLVSPQPRPTNICADFSLSL